MSVGSFTFMDTYRDPCTFLYVFLITPRYRVRTGTLKQVLKDSKRDTPVNLRRLEESSEWLFR